jgi:hypothetical protein
LELVPWLQQRNYQSWCFKPFFTVNDRLQQRPGQSNPIFSYQTWEYTDKLLVVFIYQTWFLTITHITVVLMCLEAWEIDIDRPVWIIPKLLSYLNCFSHTRTNQKLLLEEQYWSNVFNLLYAQIMMCPLMFRNFTNQSSDREMKIICRSIKIGAMTTISRKQ